jgi:hypothetical protein
MAIGRKRMSKNLYIFGKTPIFGNLKSQKPEPIHGISAIISALKDSGQPLSFKECTALYSMFTNGAKYGRDIVNDLIECDVLVRKTKKGKITLADTDAVGLLYLPVLSQPAIQTVYEEYLAVLDMKELNDGSFHTPAGKIAIKQALECDSVLIINRHKFPETYQDALKHGYLSAHSVITFDCLVTKTVNGLSSTALEKNSIFTLASYLNRRFLTLGVWYGVYVTDPVNPKPYMDFIVPHSTL